MSRMPGLGSRRAHWRRGAARQHVAARRASASPGSAAAPAGGRAGRRPPRRAPRRRPAAPASAVSTPSSPTFCADALRPLGQQPRRPALAGSARGARGDRPPPARASRPRPGASSAPKQLIVPSWQAGPTGSTRISRVSPSQSASTSRRASRLPGGLALAPARRRASARRRWPRRSAASRQARPRPSRRASAPAGSRVLHDGGQQPAAFVEVEPCDVGERSAPDRGTPHSASLSFSRGWSARPCGRRWRRARRRRRPR